MVDCRSEGEHGYDMDDSNFDHENSDFGEDKKLMEFDYAFHALLVTSHIPLFYAF